MPLVQHKDEMNGYSILQEPDTIYHHQMNLSKTQTASFFRTEFHCDLWQIKMFYSDIRHLNINT
jgi:hypothetical protein